MNTHEGVRPVPGGSVAQLTQMHAFPVSPAGMRESVSRVIGVFVHQQDESKLPLAAGAQALGPLQSGQTCAGSGCDNDGSISVMKCVSLMK